MITVDVNSIQDMSEESREKFIGWLRESGVDIANTYRVEYIGKNIQAWEYKSDFDGHKYIEVGDCTTYPFCGGSDHSHNAAVKDVPTIIVASITMNEYEGVLRARRSNE